MWILNFQNVFAPKEMDSDLKYLYFDSVDTTNKPVRIKVEIAEHPSELLPNVFNLAFGPLNAKGIIDDNARISHLEPGKMMSTVLVFGLSFLYRNPDKTVGIDGSNDSRAYLYHRLILTNKEYLKDFFIILGVDWYVRYIRKSKDVERDENGIPFFKPKPELFDYNRRSVDIYNYYLFHLPKK